MNIEMHLAGLRGQAKEEWLAQHANKAVITSTENEFTRKTFDDIGSMIVYVKDRNINIINPEALPENFKQQLITII